MSVNLDSIIADSRDKTVINSSGAITRRDNSLSHLRLACLGPPGVWLDGQPLTFATRKALALLIYLAVEGGLQPRPKLMSLFWPESDAERGRSALRSTLAYLRRALDSVSPNSSQHFLRVEADVVGFNFESSFELDVRLVEAVAGKVGAAARQNVLELYRGDFLEGFSLPDAPDFDDWLSLQREHWHRVMAQAFDHLSQAQADARQLDAAVITAARWVRHDPLDETAHRRLMELHALAGNTAAALQAYQSCRSALQTALNIDPSPPTQALAERIRKFGTVIPETENRKSKIANRKSDLPFAGRSAEYQQLINLARQAHTGQLQIVVIEGEAGIGKTRLATEFLQGLVLQGIDILEGRAFETGGRLPYQPLVEALRRRLERENAPDDLLADVWLVELSRLLPELHERYPDLPPPTPDETLGRIRLSEAVTRLGKALALRQMLALFLDDIQWADAASLDLLHYACRAWASDQLPILLLLTLRSEALVTAPEVQDWLTTLRRDVPITRLLLGPLTNKETGQLASMLIGESQGRQAENSKAEEEGLSASLSPRSEATFGEWLYHETAGQPFFITEMLKVLQEQNLVTAPAGLNQPWHIDRVPAADILPPGVRQVMLTRLSQLSPSATALLTAAAVLGRPCSFGRLCQVTGLPEMEALPDLELLLNRRFLLETGAARRPYTFAHDKLRDVVYTEAGDARRRIYHSRAFEALEQAQAPPAELAHHALTARLNEAGFRYSVAAGDAALRLFAVRDAIAHYEQARAIGAEVVASSTDWRHLYGQLARAYEVVEQPDKVEMICQEMLAVARTSAWPELECAALNRLASVAIYTQQTDQASALLLQAQQVAEASGDRAGLAQTEWSFGQLTHHTNDFVASQAHSERALALARELGDQALQAGSAQTLAFALLFQGQLAAGTAAMSEAKDGYVALGNRVLEADAFVGLAVAYLLNGEIGRSIEAARTAYRIGQAIENEFGQCMSRPWLVCGLVDEGAYEEALTLAQHNLAIARSQALAPKLLATFSAGHLYWALGDYTSAKEVHLELMPHVKAAGVPAYLEQNLASLCVDAALAGDWAAAHTFARQALTHRDYRTLPLLVSPHWPETEALLRGGDVELARQDAHRWGELVGHIPRFRVGYLRSLALLAAWDNNLGQAVSHLTEADELVRKIGLLGEQWQILDRLRELYRARGDEERAQQMWLQAEEVIQALAVKIDSNPLRAEFTKSVLARRL